MKTMYAEPNVATRMRLMRDAEQIVMNEAPITPITYYVSKRLVKPFVGGLENNIRGIHLGRYIRVERP